MTNFNIVNEAVNDIASKLYTINILNITTGIKGETKIKSHKMSLDGFERVRSINMKGNLTTFKAAAPFMHQQDYVISEEIVLLQDLFSTSP